MNQILAGILFAFAFVVALVVGLREREVERIEPAAFRAKVQETILRGRTTTVPDEKKTTPVPGSAGRQPASESQADTDQKTSKAEPLTRAAFGRRFGEELQWTTHEKRVIRIDGSAVAMERFHSAQRIPNFRPANSAELTSRGREIFEASRNLLGISPRADFMPPSVNPGESSGQVTFQQSEKGVPIYPGGLVTILVGPEGELRALDSSVYPKIEVVNAPTLPITTGARHILFVTQSAPVAVLNHAYETRERGIQKVTDAQSGALLLERNRRIR